MNQHTTPREAPEHRFPKDQLPHVIERNRGRLHVLEYACFGLSRTDGKNAACLVWVIDDILTDLDRLELSLTINPDVEEGNDAAL